MTILRTDIKLFESERLTDDPDGGGRMTGNVVVDGQANNLFPDISRLDRVYGRVNLRKAFTAVDTPNTDTYYGAHIITDDAPDDPNVGIILFSTGSHTDVRRQARDRIESYVTQGPESRMRPLGDQLAGQRTITAWQRPEARLPEIGEVYVLSVEDPGHPADGQQQYVRVRDVTAEVQTYTDNISGDIVDFEVMAITLAITSEIREDFPGGAPTRDFASGTTVIRTTQVANAAEYFGIKPVIEALTAGQTTLRLADVYQPLVPATQSETPQVDITAGARTTHEEQSGGQTVEVTDFAETAGTEVTIQNRGLAWVKNLAPLPAPGTTVVEYRALGNWNRVTDRGDGKLEGDGAGTVDFATGSVSLTLAALPDVGTSILFTWGTPVQYTDRGGGQTNFEPPILDIDPPFSLSPGSVMIQWEKPDGTMATATDDGAGNLVGDATGSVIYG